MYSPRYKYYWLRKYRFLSNIRYGNKSNIPPLSTYSRDLILIINLLIILHLLPEYFEVSFHSFIRIRIVKGKLVLLVSPESKREGQHQDFALFGIFLLHKMVTSYLQARPFQHPLPLPLALLHTKLVAGIWLSRQFRIVEITQYFHFTEPEMHSTADRKALY